MRTLLLGAVGAVALAGLTFSTNAQAQCWPSAYGYYSCTTPPAMYYGYGSSAPSYYNPTPYPAWNAYDYRDYRYNPQWLPSYPGPRASSGWGW